jgi:AraC-like DNA-binding protein
VRNPDSMPAPLTSAHRWEHIAEQVRRERSLVGKLALLLEDPPLGSRPDPSLHRCAIKLLVKTWLTLAVREQVSDLQRLETADPPWQSLDDVERRVTAHDSAVHPSERTLVRFDVAFLKLLTRSSETSLEPRIFATIIASDRLPLDGLSASTLASDVGLSTERFRKLFKTETHVNLRSFLLRIKARRTLALFFDHCLPLKDIAYRLGYSHLANFHRDFRRIYGVNPRAYRNELKTLMHLKLGVLEDRI